LDLELPTGSFESWGIVLLYSYAAENCEILSDFPTFTALWLSRKTGLGIGKKGDILR
jgi:hypothetical protein